MDFSCKTAQILFTKTEDNYMKLVIHLDPEATQQLAEIELHTNQDLNIILHQAIGLYYQQIHRSSRIHLPQGKRSKLSTNCTVPF